MPKYLLTAFALAALLAAPAQAERTSFFLLDAIKGENGEIANATLAQQRAASPAVRQFAETLVRDHTASRNKAIAAAQSAHVGIPRVMTPRAQHLRRRLLRRSGAEFDRMFVEGMISDHKKAIALYAEQARTGDKLTRELAQDALPALRDHLRVALSLR